MNDQNYSITAYCIVLKERERGKNGARINELDDHKDYIQNKKNFLNDFITWLNNRNYQSSNNYFKIKTSTVTDGDINGQLIDVLYGKNGREFMTIDKDFNENVYDEQTKYICKYKLYFFILNKNLIMVSFRQGKYGCKSALCNEIVKFLDNTNVILQTKVISNEKYISEIINNADFQKISYSLYYNYDDGEKSKVKKDIFSNVSFELKSPSNKKKLNFIIDFLKGVTKENLITVLSNDNNIANNSMIDDSSLKLIIKIAGIKRVVNLADFESMMYDVDITSKLEFNKNGHPTQESINEVVLDYVKGVKVIENE